MDELYTIAMLDEPGDTLGVVTPRGGVIARIDTMTPASMSDADFLAFIVDTLSRDLADEAGYDDEDRKATIHAVIRQLQNQL